MFIFPHSPRKVCCTREDVAEFNAGWPCSPLSAARHYWFEFDGDGDLIDTDVPEHSDGDASVALCADALRFLEDNEA